MNRETTNWECAPLRELCVKTTYVDPTKTPDSSFEYIDVSSVSNEIWKIIETTRHSALTAPSRARKLVKADDVIFATVRPTLKRVAIVPKHLDNQIASTAFCVVRVRPEKAAPYFIYYSLLTKEFINRIANLQRGANYPAVTDSNVLDQEILIPPLPEQRAIAAVLAKIQSAIETQDKMIAALKELKAAALAKLFREGLLACRPPADALAGAGHGAGRRSEKLKQTEIGEIPESWEVVRIGDYCEQPRYGYTESANSEPIGPKFLRITDITEHGVNWDSVPYCKCPDAVLNELGLKHGDIVFARIGATTGKSYLISDCPVAVFASYLIRLRTKQGLDPAYLSCFFETNTYWTQVRANKGNNMKGGMNASILSNLLFPIPSVEEQKRIAKILKDIDGKILLNVKQRDFVNSLFSSILHLLMTGQVRLKPRMIALLNAEALEKKHLSACDPPAAARSGAQAGKKYTGKVDEKVLNEIVNRIVDAVQPEKIILFGSAARGEMGPDSDLDFLVVKSGVHRRETAWKIRRSLIGIGIGIPKDILVATSEDLQRHKDTIGLIYRPALRDGKVVYHA